MTTTSTPVSCAAKSGAPRRCSISSATTTTSSASARTTSSPLSAKRSTRSKGHQNRVLAINVKLQQFALPNRQFSNHYRQRNGKFLVQDEDCWIGELNGLRGWFPAKFVQLLDERSKQYRYLHTRLFLLRIWFFFFFLFNDCSWRL